MRVVLPLPLGAMSPAVNSCWGNISGWGTLGCWAPMGTGTGRMRRESESFVLLLFLWRRRGAVLGFEEFVVGPPVGRWEIKTPGPSKGSISSSQLLRFMV